MRIFNVEIKKVAKEVKPMTCEQVDRTVLGMDPDDTPVKEKKPKKNLKKKVVAGIGVGIAVLGALASKAAKGSDTDGIDSGDDFEKAGNPAQAENTSSTADDTAE